MTIISADESKMVNTGTSDTLRALYSTAFTLLKEKGNQIKLGLEFLKTGNCTVEQTGETLKQLKTIKKELSSFKPDEAVYDYRNPKKEAPWKDNISNDVTSCADLFTTDDGKDLLLELIDMLAYTSSKGIAIEVLG